MTLLLVAAALLAISALFAPAAGAVLAALLGISGAMRVLLGGAAESVRFATPLGGVHELTLDPLAAWFIAPVLFVGAACAVYGRRGAALFNLLIADIVIVLLATDAITFLVAWELMTLLSFLLVTHEHQRSEVRAAGLLYLVLTHAGTLCLLAFFALLHGPTSRVALFALAAVGFSCKAGAWPLHVWLPAAHPVAPSHVSAFLSGVVIKTGIYGILRACLLLAPLPAGCGIALLALGAASALLGVLSALAQHELKRLLAYHSVENIGIILIGAGVGVIALAAHNPAVAALGFAGALLHVTNHALFKSLLFLAAGAVKKAAGTLQIDRLGGLLKSMPRTALAFALGAAAISGLPPLNGFVSELLVYLSLFGAFALPLSAHAPAILALAALACVGGLAAACFAKATGAVFLGTPRTPISAREASREMLAPMAVIGAACVAIGLAGPLLMTALARPVQQLAGVAPVADLRWVSVLGASLIALAALFRLARPAFATGPTWGCGYALPTPRMQYTSASFAQPLVSVFRAALFPHRNATLPRSPFPGAIALEEHCPDPIDRFVLSPALFGGAAALRFLRRAQPTRVQWYVALVFAALVVLLVWRPG